LGDVSEQVTPYSDGLTQLNRYNCHVFTDLFKIEWATLMTLGTMAFVDFVVAASLSYLLATSRTGFSR
jgi:hypothetical protein